ncbi:MAG: SDR family NAD(P)-dependent oxidoreductase [Gammaproteobacteria bacterium]|nr:SDR family NAD(P)-dependent oxidoreductase [Gammaproteobacteria bacterium]
MKSVLITGNSSGLGYGLTQTYLKAGYRVFGMSRRGCDINHPQLIDIQCDLSDPSALTSALKRLPSDLGKLDLVILNAGILGPVGDLTRTGIDQIDQVMQINLWSNKRIIDWLAGSDLAIDQIVTISSGASISGNKGWGAYSISKAALNLLTGLYAHEMPETHFTALAPGLIDTAMQDQLCDHVDPVDLPAVTTLKAARGTDSMPQPEKAGELIAEAIGQLTNYPSGAYVDIRNM